MKLTVIMPAIEGCEAHSCAFNQNGGCHARAITVGDGTHAQCDTFVGTQPHTASTERAGVAACKVVACRYNRDLECGAESIRMQRHRSHADCATFAA